MKNFAYYFLFVCISSFALLGCQNAPTSSGGSTPSLKIAGNYTGCGIGVFLHDGLPSAESIDAYESLISREVSVVMWFQDFTCPFYTDACETVNQHHSIPMITWEPWNALNHSDPLYTLDNINSGSFDAYISEFAATAKAWGKPMFIRFAHEMNGNWYPWSGMNNGQSGAKYISAWQRIYSTFEALGVKNVTWVWCPMNYSVPNGAGYSWNDAANYYPGNGYVDWLAFDAYANSEADNSGTDESVAYSGIYNTLQGSFFSNKPIMIGENASGTFEAADKPGWITNAFNGIQNSYPRIKLYVWFNLNKDSNWRVDSSPDSLNAFKAAMTDPYYLSSIH